MSETNSQMSQEKNYRKGGREGGRWIDKQRRIKEIWQNVHI